MGSNLSMVAECKATTIRFERFVLFSFDLKFVFIVFIDEASTAECERGSGQ